MRREALQRFWLASKCGAASFAKLARMAASPARSAANLVACKQRRKLCDERCESREASEDRCKPCEERREPCEALRGERQALPRFKLAPGSAKPCSRPTLFAGACACVCFAWAYACAGPSCPARRIWRCVVRPFMSCIAFRSV